MNPSVQWVGISWPHPDGILAMGARHLDIIELAGRWDYGAKSVGKMSGEPEAIIKRWLDSGEESMIEMVDCSFLIECSRVVTHELVRHRIASYQMESQRFVSYEDEDFDDLFYVPLGMGETAEQVLRASYKIAHDAYLTLRSKGVPKQIARYVLPNGTRTRIVAKMNLREWRHVLRLRLHTSAQPEMQFVMAQVLSLLQAEFGTVVFPDDIAAERSSR